MRRENLILLKFFYKELKKNEILTAFEYEA